MWTEVLEQLQALLVTVLLAAIPIVGMVLVNAINKWGEKQKNDRVAKVTSEVSWIVHRAVQAVHQSFAQHVRGEDGKLSLDNAKTAFGLALQYAKDQMGQDLLKSLVKIVGGEDKVDLFLRPIIESAVFDTKPTESSSDYLSKKG